MMRGTGYTNPASTSDKSAQCRATERDRGYAGMARKRGRPADAQHRRMRVILGALATRGQLGVTRERLEREIGDVPDPRQYVKRDIRKLRDAGWDIRSVKRDDGDYYVLRVVDVRLRRAFPKDERAELLRAAQDAGLGQLYEDLGRTKDGTPAEVDPRIGDVQSAITLRCLLRFVYKHKARVVDPYILSRKNKGWLLTGLEVGSGVEKNFYVHDMGDLDVDLPGTAGVAPDDLSSVELNAVKWQVHEPIEAVVETHRQWADEVARQLGESTTISPGPDEDTVRLTLQVTHTAAFLARLFNLETRVRLVGGDAMRDAARARLLDVR